MERKEAYYWCTHLQMAAPVKVSRILADCEHPQEVFSISDACLKKQYRFSERELQIMQEARTRKEMITCELKQLSQKQIQFVSREEESFPRRLRELPDCPCGLFVKGSLPPVNACCVAIVGARACSSYGRACAEQMAAALSEKGICVISGMAYGIDAAAHRAAIEKGQTYAVLGGGVNLCYPRDHRQLYEQLVQKGGILSEMRPDTPGTPGLFPRRNRIISGICDAVIVVEARIRSGSLITAEFAGEQGRYVYAIPGSIQSGLSEGCHELIRNGAILLHRPEDILEDLLPDIERVEACEVIGKNELSAQEEDIYRLIGSDIVAQEELLMKSAYPVGDLAQILLSLELKGYLRQTWANHYQRTAVIPPGFNRNGK